jgi:hypothetical protein
MRFCLVCCKGCLATFGEHATHCPASRLQIQTNLIRDVLFDILGHARISVKKVAPVNFLTDPQEERSTLRSTDVLMYGWIGGKYVCVD